VLTAVTAITAVSAIALPATGTASPKSKQRSHHNAILVAGPLHVRAYKMYLIASPPQPHNKANLLVIFERGNDNDYQTHYYGFSHRVSVKIGADGRSAKIDANLKPFGHVHLTFAPGNGGSPLPAICGNVTIGQQGGTLSGRSGFDLVTHSPYFHSVRTASIPAYITAVKGKSNCIPKPSTSTTGVTQLTTTSTQPGRTLTNFTASRSAKGYTTEDVLLIDQTSPTGPAILHAIHVAAVPQPEFSFAADLSSANVKAWGTFLTGGFDFAKTVQETAKMVLGNVTGGLDAHFDGIGVVPLQSAPVLATLSK